MSSVYLDFRPVFDPISGSGVDETSYACSDGGVAHFGETLQRLLTEKHFTQREFCKAAGIAGDTLNRHLKAPTAKMNQTTYRAIAAALEMTPVELDRAWRPTKVPQQDEAKQGIPVFDQVPAGVGDFDPTVLGQDQGRADFYIPRELVPNTNDPTAYGVRVKGDSMVPDFFEGDIVIVSPQAQHVSPMWAVFRLDDGSCGLKIVEAAGDTDLLLLPRNPLYTPRRVPRETVVQLARVVGFYRPMPGMAGG